MVDNAADAEKQRWRRIRDKVFGAKALTREQKATAWKQLIQQELSLVERLLDVEANELTDVLLGEISGAGSMETVGAPRETTGAAGKIRTPADDVGEVLASLFARLKHCVVHWHSRTPSKQKAM